MSVDLQTKTQEVALALAMILKANVGPKGRGVFIVVASRGGFLGIGRKITEIAQVSSRTENSARGEKKEVLVIFSDRSLKEDSKIKLFLAQQRELLKKNQLTLAVP